jgi:hypothetical protein
MLRVSLYANAVSLNKHHIMKKELDLPNSHEKFVQNFEKLCGLHVLKLRIIQ